MTAPWTLLAALVAATAQAGDDGEGESRDEDAMFGGTTAPAESTPDPAVAPPESLPGLPAGPSEAAIGAVLAAADDRLVFGGRMYLRSNVAVPEDAEPENVRLDSPNLLDMFADARPNDTLRAYTSVRLRHDFATLNGDTSVFGQALSPSRVTLDQMWLKFDVARAVYVTAGRQRVKWGAGRFWNPTDVLNRQRLDALAFFDERTGVSMVRAHLPIERWGANVYGVVDIEGANALVPDEAAATRVNGVGGALRAEWAFPLGEVTATAARRAEGLTVLGGDLSVAVGPLDLRVEGAVAKGGDAHRWTGALDLSQGTLPTRVDRGEEWIPQVTAGIEVPVRLNDEDTLAMGAEAFWNDAGYDDPTLYPWLLAQGDFQGFYVGRAYAAVYAFLSGPGNWDDTAFTASTLANLSDESLISRLDVSTTLATYLQLNVFGQVSYGEHGEFFLELDLPAVPGFLDAPLRVPATRAQAGIGASVRF
ncbi:MAG: hypothetical protein RLZZ299_1394 [Pseudomonadota bacterium]|jgi:hypothetical protein